MLLSAGDESVRAESREMRNATDIFEYQYLSLSLGVGDADAVCIIVRPPLLSSSFINPYAITAAICILLRHRKSNLAQIMSVQNSIVLNRPFLTFLIFLLPTLFHLLQL